MAKGIGRSAQAKCLLTCISFMVSNAAISQSSSVFNSIQDLLSPVFSNALNTGFESAGKFTIELPDNTGGNTFDALLVSYGSAMSSGKCNNDLYHNYDFRASNAPLDYNNIFQTFFLRGSNIYNAASSVSVVPSNVACISYQAVNNVHATTSTCDQAVSCTSDSTASVCKADPLENCSVTFHAPLAYAVAYAEQKILQCSVNPDGLLGGCAEAPTPGLSYSSTEGPADIIFSQDGATAYISYLTGTVPFAGPPTGGDVVKCSVDSNGSFNSCVAQDIVSKGATDVVPVKMVLNSAANALYITSEYNGENVFRCVVDSSGDISSCEDAGAPAGATFANPIGIALNAAQNIVYVSNTNQEGPTHPPIEVCHINPATGLFSSCEDSTSTSGFNTASGVTLNTLNNMAYITDVSTGQVFQCSVDSSTGLFTNCWNAIIGGGTFNFPLAIRFNASNSIAYIIQLNLPNNDSPIVSNFAAKCDVDAYSGSLTCNTAEPESDNYAYTTSTGFALRFG